MNSFVKFSKGFNRVVAKVCEVLFWLLLCFECISLLVVLYWVVVNAFKGTTLEFARSQFGLPEHFTFDNFKYFFEKIPVIVTKSNGVKIQYGIWDMLGMSFFYSTALSCIHVFFYAAVAYVIARYKFPGGKFLYNFGIVLMILPILGSLPSAMVVKKTFGIYDNLPLALLTAPVGCFYGLHFLILHACFKGIPKEYTEAAQIDGCGHYKIMLKVIFPMAIPTMVVIFVLYFLTSWNDYTTFLIWLPSTPNLAFGVYNFKNRASFLGANFPQVLAGFLFAALPVIILYTLSQKVIMSKFTVGGLKG